MNAFGLPRRRLFAGLWVVGIVWGLTTAVRSEEPRWLKLSMPETSVGMEVEGSREETRVGGVNSTYEHLALTPLLGLRTHGSIYHPNLLSFDLTGETGWGWDSTTTKSPGFSQTTDENQDLRRYLVQANILSTKPYNATFFASQDHTYQDYGNFSTYTVDSSRYGGRVGWVTETLNLNADMGYRDEKSTGLNDFSELAETYFNFTGIQHRQSGQTTLNYRYDAFDNTLNYRRTQSSVNHAVGISDSETFGSRKQITATTGASYSQSQYAGQDTETITANENVSINHTPNLDSYFACNFSLRQMNAASNAPSQSRVQGVYGIRHQLYESLTSNLDVHGSYDDNSGSGNSASNDRYGVGLFENYTKRLGSWGRLTLGGGTIADHQDYNSSGTMLTTIDESLQLYLTTSPNYRPGYLNHPRVIITSIEVNAGGDPLSLNADYQIIQSGELTEIRLVSPPSAHVSALLRGNDNLAVAVTYNSETLGDASYESFNTTAQIRLDLFSKFGIYSRMNWLDNNAPPDVLVQSLTDMVGGVDYAWQWVRAGAEYEDYDSNYSKYKAWRFYENFDFRPGADSTLSVNFIQSSYQYPDGDSQTQYQFLGRFNIQLLYSLAWFAEGGYSIQDVSGTEQLLGSARTGLTWTRGKLSIRTGYDYNSQTTSTPGQSTQEIVKNHFYAYLKRSFW